MIKIISCSMTQASITGPAGNATASAAPANTIAAASEQITSFL